MQSLTNWLRRHAGALLTDLGLVLVLVHFGLGGPMTGWQLLRLVGPVGWALLGGVLFLLLYQSDYRRDLPLFCAGLLLGYWGEWWGTTRGVWFYWNGATPPGYLPPLWGLGLLTVERLSRPLHKRMPEVGHFPSRLVSGLVLTTPLLLALLYSRPRLAAVDWSTRLDIHFFSGLLAAGLLVAATLRDPDAGLGAVLAVYLPGMLLGGVYEALGTSWGEWTYITGETPPLWIAPLWGYTCVAMLRLAKMLQVGGANLISRRLPAPAGERS